MTALSSKKLPRLKPRGGLKVMYIAIRALFLRELQTRFGPYRLGYLWVFLEPLCNIGIMILLFGTVMHRTLPGMDYPVFLANGILPFFMFRKGVLQSLNAVQSNKGLFSYRPVKPIDSILARSVMEGFLSFTTYLFFSLILLWWGYHINFDSIPQLVGYWFLLFLFMTGCSLILMVIGDFSREIGKFLSALFLILYFLSGIIYSIHVIPEQYLQYLLWNPIIHIVEHMRNAVAPTYPLVEGIDLGYFVEWTVGSIFLGLLLYKRFEHRMVKSK
ncbi:MAG: ABC transporter permease [Acinetobacter sp.]